LSAETQPELKRALKLPMLVLYGLGTTIGTGIYALVGEIAGAAGYGAPISFVIACAVAACTACSFAELVARFPRAGAAALYVQHGFDSRRLALLVGMLVVASGVVSCAAMLNGFVGYLQEFVDVGRTLAIVTAAVTLALIAAWGIRESVIAASLVTLVEIGGLFFIIGLGAGSFESLPERWTSFVPGAPQASWTGILFGVTLAFYAFIGFEDMVDVAEETRDAGTTIPRAILLTLGLTTLLYVLLMVTALLALPPDSLRATDAPLATLYTALTGREPALISLIALIAIVNGALIQIIMASRVLYGLASRGQLPALLARVSARTRTPLTATAVITVLLLITALSGRLAGLANAASLIMLCIFTLVNLALWRLKAQGSSPPPGGPRMPRALPLVGALLCAGFVVWELTALVGVRPGG